ncbi:MAG: zf-HC2 domain-containing protein [Planctomycetota bacterium]
MSDLSCREFIDFIDGFLDGRLNSSERERFDGHVAICTDCQAYLQTYKDSVTVFRDVCTDETPVPEDAPNDLVDGILQALGRRGAEDSPPES